MSRFALLFALLVICATPLVAQAEGDAMPPPPAVIATPMPEPAASPTPAPDFIPPQAMQVTPAMLEGELSNTSFPILRLTPDKIEVLRLEADAANVIVGNAKHLVAMVETPRQIMLIPRLAGATHFQVLNAAGDTIMERDVIIAAPKQDYVRVRRTCTAGKKNCEEMSMFYCPDMCHQVALTQKDKANGGGATSDGGTASGEASADNAASDGLEGSPTSGAQVPAVNGNTAMMP